MNRRRVQSHSGFTLIEVMIVVVIMAMLAASVRFSFRRPMQHAAQSDAIELMHHFDSYARISANRFNRATQLVFDLENQSMTRIENDAEVSTLRLPSAIHLTELRTAHHRISDSRHVVNLSPPGVGPTYAVHLEGADFDRWLLFAGMTGEMSTAYHEQQLDSIFTTLAAHSAQRTDAD